MRDTHERDLIRKRHGMGRVPSPFDRRDFNLGAFIPKAGLQLTLIRSKNWDFPAPEALNQDETPHCVGFSMADFGINLPVYTKYTNEDGHKFYRLCKIEDKDPLGENGSNLRSAAKVLQNLKRIKGYAFASTLAQVKYWLLHKGPLIAGTFWTENMNYPNIDNILDIGGEIIGGHAYLLSEWTKDGFIGIQNSWGDNWGIKGKAYISAIEFEKIFRQGGEVVTSVEVVTAGSGKVCGYPR